MSNRTLRRVGRCNKDFTSLALAAALAALLVGLLPQGATAAQFDSLFPSKAQRPVGDSAEPLTVAREYRSEGGKLDITLEAKETTVKLGKIEIKGATYNGVYGGPVLRLKPGDVMHLRLVNHLPQATNIHFHGLEVSPMGHSDNSMQMVGPGQTWDYEIKIPKDHPPGVYWFHTHGHGFAERQLMGGLSGTLIVEGFQDEIPATKPLKERIFALKEFSPSGTGELNRVPKPFNDTIKTINGQLMPRVDIRPGETQLWRLSDQTANTYFRLALDGHSFTVVGRDAHPVAKPETTKELILGPGERADVLVTGGSAGAYKLVAEKTSTGPAGDMFQAQDMAVVVSAVDASKPSPAPLAPLVIATHSAGPISGEKIDAERLVAFSEDPVTGLFFINHVVFDHDRVDLKVPLGNVEEWTIRNASDELHIFHIHQVAFQVISENGKPLPFDGLLDTINVPIHGEVKIRIAFTDPTIIGRFMFHCHILEHEDKGMMQQMEVYDPKVGPMPDGPMDMGTMDHSKMAMNDGQPAAESKSGAAAHVSH